MLAEDPNGVQPGKPHNAKPVPDSDGHAHSGAPLRQLSNFTDDDYVALAAQNPAFEAWLIGQPGVLSLPDQAKRIRKLTIEYTRRANDQPARPAPRSVSRVSCRG